jgi:hypothetical protein
MAIQLVKVGILERDSIDIDDIDEVKTQQDYITAKGFSFRESQDIYIDDTGSDIAFHTITHGTKTIADFLVDTNTDNTASNVGTGGVGVFKQKTGVDLEFRNINNGSNLVSVTLDIPNNEIDIDVNESNIDHDNLTNYVLDEHRPLNDSATTTTNLWSADKIQTEISNASGTGEVNTASNLGTGEGIFSVKVGPDLQFKSLIAGDNILLSSDANEITIDSEGIAQIDGGLAASVYNGAPEMVDGGMA